MSVLHKKRHPFDRNVKKVLSETRREAESIVRGSGKRFKRTSRILNSHICVSSIIFILHIYTYYHSYIYIYLSDSHILIHVLSSCYTHMHTYITQAAFRKRRPEIGDRN